MERIDKIGFGNLKLIQEPDEFCYGVDAVILADFAWSLYPAFKNAVDLGTGTGIIPLILSHKNKNAALTGIDVQEHSIVLAKKNCSLNGLEDRLRFFQADVAALDKALFDGGANDMVTCNPPYFARGGAIPSSNQAKYIARHETTATADDFIRAAAELLNGKGHFFMVHRPSRLVDLFISCRSHGLEPKHIRLVAPRAGEVPNIVLLHCTAGGGSELQFLKELCVYGTDGHYSNEIQRIYERQPELI